MSNSIIRVTKQFTFDMAHALYGHDGLCKNIHGHTYKLSVTLAGKVIDKTGAPKDGMVMDFGDFKSIVHKQIISVYDHALVLNGNSPHRQIKHLTENFQKIVFFQTQPTCENLVLEVVQKLKGEFPKGIRLHSVRLDETPTSFAEWFALDN